MAEIVELYAGFASPIDLHFAALSDLESVPSKAGWYAWFYIPDSLDEASLQIYRQAKVVSTVNGIFNLTFEGRLTPKGTHSNLPRSPELVDTVKSLFVAFAPPLYIGISVNLRSRLKSHRKRLQEFIDMGDSNDGAAIENGIQSDTEDESRYFGTRIGSALRTFRLSADRLFVKCVEADDAAVLRETERILNFALTPHYGRR